MGDAPLWQTIPLYGLGLLAAAGVLFVVVLLGVRVALRPQLEHQRSVARRQEALLREIAGSAEYVADVADAWAEREAESVAGPRDIPARDEHAPSDSVSGRDREQPPTEQPTQDEPGDDGVREPEQQVSSPSGA